MHLQKSLEKIKKSADRIGLDRRRGGDRAGDDLALRHQAFDAGVDQPVAELVEIENADDQHAERRRG